MIEFENVIKKYKEQVVLNDISFKIDDNDLVLLVGDNGSGKTTIINLILGILKINKSDSGKIINDFKYVSYFPEKFVLPNLIKSHTFLYTYFKGLKSKEEIDSFISKYNILNKCICNLSKGMVQKIIIAKTILEESNLYIFDKPLNGLDDESRNIFLEDIIDLKNKGKTIIISTHEPDFFNVNNIRILRVGELCE